MKKYDFWDELRSLREEFPEASWGYLENEYSLFGLSPYDFLHGSCDIFAEVLHEKYGYTLEYAECLGLLHAYCVKELDGHTYYIDVRGICSDYDEFLEDFKEYFIEKKFSIARLDSIPERYIHSDNICRERSAAKAIIEYYNYYGPDKIELMHKEKTA